MTFKTNSAQVYVTIATAPMTEKEADVCQSLALHFEDERTQNLASTGRSTKARRRTRVKEAIKEARAVGLIPGWWTIAWFLIRTVVVQFLEGYLFDRE